MQLLPTRPTKSWLVTEYADGRPEKVFESVRHDAFVSSVIAAIHGEQFADAVRSDDAETAAPETSDVEPLKVAA